MSLAELLPSVAKVIRHSVPERQLGKVPGYSQSSQYAGQVIGPLMGRCNRCAFPDAFSVHRNKRYDSHRPQPTGFASGQFTKVKQRTAWEAASLLAKVLLDFLAISLDGRE
jgi:hypothetical protein